MDKDYDVKYVLQWMAPENTGVPIITMPNIPKALHGVAPRTLLGNATWNRMRKACYYHAGFRCEVCGYEPEKGGLHAHELYETNWVLGEARFVRCVALCRKCHLFGIHTGRAITLHKQDNPLYPTEKMLDGAEHTFRLVHDYNQKHPDKPLRVYSTFLDYLKVDDLKDTMEKLIRKYDIKFYQENEKVMADWSDWELVVGGKRYKTPYANEEEWEEAMKERAKKDSSRKAVNNFKGEIYDKLDEILKAS